LEQQVLQQEVQHDPPCFACAGAGITTNAPKVKPMATSRFMMPLSQL
jgi:hypothetical protein